MPEKGLRERSKEGNDGTKAASETPESDSANHGSSKTNARLDLPLSGGCQQERSLARERGAISAATTDTPPAEPAIHNVK